MFSWVFCFAFLFSTLTMSFSVAGNSIIGKCTKDLCHTCFSFTNKNKIDLGSLVLFQLEIKKTRSAFAINFFRDNNDDPSWHICYLNLRAQNNQIFSTACDGILHLLIIAMQWIKCHKENKAAVCVLKTFIFCRFDGTHTTLTSKKLHNSLWLNFLWLIRQRLFVSLMIKYLPQ